jgi:thioredoxin 1
MSTFSRHATGLAFVGGIIAGTALVLAVFRASDYSMISRSDLDAQSRLIDQLQKENHELTNDLFMNRGPDVSLDDLDLPYRDDAEAASTVESARDRAIRNGKFLMVTFGANWCLDCRTLHHHLQSPEVRAFTTDTFDFVNVNVGKFNQNVDLANDLGINLQRGIPVAIFFGPNGQVIGTTNHGELEPTRYYTSRQILKFIRDVAEKSLIAKPDSVQ